MALPLDEALGLQNELKGYLGQYEGLDFQVDIFQPEGETAVHINVSRLDGHQLKAIMEINRRNRSVVVRRASEASRSRSGRADISNE